MGWLRDLMSTSDPPVPSFGRLATAALAHPSWPAETRPQPRSLSTLFSKLDREQELEWLADRLEVQRILAELLHRPVADIQQALPLRRAPSSRLLRLDDLRYGRELDLSKEPLCPGLPARVLEPATWGRLCWRAPSGSGRSLVGAWLEARGLASHVTLTRPPEADDVFESRGPLFIELAEWEGPPPAPDVWQSWSGFWRAGERPVCVALPQPPRAPDWEIIDSPPLSSILPDLVRWVAARLPPDGHFEPELALAWLTRVALPSEAVVTLGDALGLLGMLDEIRPRTLHGRSLDEIAESFISKRLAESSEETTVGSWLGKNAHQALLGTIAQLLVESDHPWNQPRTFDEWLKLVPAEYREGIDIEWMRAALPRGRAHRMRHDDLLDAARKLPPGGYQLLRAFQKARLLVPHGERLRLRPHWLGTTLGARATHELLETSPFTWGEALLRPAHAGRLSRGLFSRALRGHLSAHHAVLELSDPENPAYVAALEAATTTLGLAAASGAQVPTDLARDLLTEQEQVGLLWPDGSPRPRIAHDPLTQDEPLLWPAAWFLGVHLLAESAGRHRGPLHLSQLPDPRARRELLRLSIYPELLELLQHALEEPLGTSPKSSVHLSTCELKAEGTSLRYPWPLTIYSLVDTLRSQLGAAAETPTPLELPGVLAERLERGSGSLELERLEELPLALAALADRALARGLPWSSFCERLWHALGARAHLPRILAPSRTGDPLVRELWRRAPVELVKRRVTAGRPVPWEHLLPHHHAGLLSTPGPLPAEVSRLAPIDALLDALEARGPSLFTPEAQSALWRRAPRRLLALFGRKLDARELSAVVLLLESLPDEQTELVLAPLTHQIDIASLPLAKIHPFRRWLAARVSRRTASWPQAYALLHRIEVTLEPLRGQLWIAP